VGDSPAPGEEANCRCWAEWGIEDSYDPMKYNLGAVIKHLNEKADELKRDQIARNKPNEYGNKKCAEYVREAIEKGLKYIGGTQQALAKDFGIWLENNGFVQVASWDKTSSLPLSGYVEGYEPRTGDVVVIQNTGEHPRGHAAMYNGTQWVSDFRQRDMWGGNIRDDQPKYIIYRHRD
jgi:hypothetical protein